MELIFIKNTLVFVYLQNKESNNEAEQKAVSDRLLHRSNVASQNYMATSAARVAKGTHLATKLKETALQGSGIVTNRNSVDKQDSSVDKQDSSVDKQDSSVDKQDSSVDKQARSVDKQYNTVNKQCSSVAVKQGSSVADSVIHCLTSKRKAAAAATCAIMNQSKM